MARFLAFLLGPGRTHFTREEELLAPEIPADSADLGRRLLSEHEDILRRAGALGRAPTVDAAHELGSLLRGHVRFEERELFPLLEARLSPDRLGEIADALDA